MRKQAGYMAAPERFADRSDSSCTAGAVHTWHTASEIDVRSNVSCWGDKQKCCKRSQPDAPDPEGQLDL
jgi:hypothetical protein